MTCGDATEETHAASGFSNWYAQSKLLAEAEVRRVEAECSLQTVILRPATVYGPGSREVVGEIARAIRSRQMLLVGGGRAVAGLCYVDNLIDAAVLALHHEAAPGQAFNVSDGDLACLTTEGRGRFELLWHTYLGPGMRPASMAQTKR